MKTKEKKYCLCCKKRNLKQVCRECRLWLRFLESTFNLSIDIPLIEGIILHRNPKNVIDYIIDHGEEILVEQKELLQRKICPLCQKPHNLKTQLCGVCNRKKKELSQRLERSFSISTLLYIKQKYEIDDIFSFLFHNKTRIDWGNHQLRMENKREYRDQQRLYQAIPFEKEIENVPDYILSFFKKNEDKMLLYIDGQRSNPLIVYECNKCGKEIAVRWDSILKGHNCESIKSSGEVIIETYLKSVFKIKTQRDTLSCLNPLTNHIMPYDIEIPSKKLIIEVQGEQHLKFIPYFHITEDGFLYQKYKDQIKREYAESCGYRVIYLFYEDIKSGRYKKILSDYLS